MMGISFDLSRKSTGVVYWKEQEPVKTETWTLPKGYLGEHLFELERSLTEAIRTTGDVHWIAYERSSVVNYYHASIQLAMVGILHKVAYEKGITILGIHPGTLKKVITGSGKAKKHEVMDAAIVRFPDLDVPNDDVADAIAVGLAFFEQVELSPVEAE